MNKKKLSVVMAGAMLASSVSPVLAATESTASAAQLGLLIKEVRETLESKYFTDTTGVAGDRNKGLSNKSVYYVKVNGVEVTAISTAATKDSTTLQGALQSELGNLAKGAKVEIWSRGYVEEGDKVYANGLQKTYTEDLLKGTELKNEIKKELTVNDVENNKTLIDLSNANIATNYKYDSDAKTLTLTFVGNLKGGFSASTAKSKKVIKVGDPILNFAKYIDKNGATKDVTSTTAPTGVYGFVEKEEKDLAYIDNYKDELVKTITITEGGNSFKTSDLYDGLMLTTEGHDFLAKVKEADTKATFSTVTGLSIGTATYTLPKNSDGTYSFVVTIEDGFGSKTSYTVTGEQTETQTLLKWLFNKHANVDLLAGDNRYETAVKIAEEYAELNETASNKAANISDIVLVNGNSLVDGLAAAPLASVLGKKAASGAKKAPIVLTESDKLPKATKDYLVRILKTTNAISTAPTIHLVGGTSVLSRNLQNELKTLGFNVVRYNGENREETSLKVAETVLAKSDNKDDVFVVGANGEADAMSIAPIAAKSSEQAPIIVSKNGGLSYDGLDFIDEITNAKVTVIGGENSVSKEDFESLKEGIDADGALRRIAGANRKATNALIINQFYTTTGIASTNSVVVAKDGQNNKSELIDALTAANLASEKKAPIVLATNNLSTEQVNALELRAKSANNVYQVGLGVNRDVVKTVAQRLGLVK